MNKLRSVLCLVLVVVLAFGIIVYPFTVSASVSDVNSYWDWIQLSPIGQWSYILDHAYNALQDKLHPECDHNWVSNGHDGSIFYYKCSICGEIMQMDRTGFGKAYNDYVSGLPATGYTSAGHLIWQPTVDDIYDVYVKNSNSVNGSFRKIPYSSDTVNQSVLLTRNSSGDGIFYSRIHSSSESYVGGWGLSLTPRYNILFHGLYRYLPSRKAHTKAILSNSVLEKDFSYSVSDYFNSHSEDPDHLYFDYSYEYHYCYPFNVSGQVYGFEIELFLPVFEVIPDTGFGDIYNITTRATSITGDVYYIDDGGQAVFAENVTIVNETNNTFYNPVTKETKPFGDWTYDYTDRRYTCNCDDGITYITFGDDCIVIDDGENVYYVYYSAPSSDAPSEHVHEWYQTGASQATCTEYGTKTYTCYGCNEQKTELLPALGHAWSFVSFVSARFDDDGKLLENAYVLYACTRCGEEWHDYEGAGPPDPGGGDYQSILDWLNEFRDWLDDRLDGVGGGDTNVQLPDLSFDTDYDITIKDENGEDQKFSILGILAAFAWWKDVADIGKEMVSQVSAAEIAAYNHSVEEEGSTPTGAPSIPVNLSAAQSYYGAVYGEDMEMLDLSWYTPYKKTVDDLVSGFLWICFIWALFRHAPGVISGAGLTVNRISDISEGEKGRRK